MQSRWGDGAEQATAHGYLADALTELGEHAKQYKVPPLFEPLNRYETNMVVNIEAGLALLDRLGTKNVRLLTDLFLHEYRRNGPGDGRARGLPDWSRALRRFHVGWHGLGHIDYQPIAKA